jgi:hypothetical protein
MREPLRISNNQPIQHLRGSALRRFDPNVNAFHMLLPDSTPNTGAGGWRWQRTRPSLLRPSGTGRTASSPQKNRLWRDTRLGQVYAPCQLGVPARPLP